MNDDVKKLKKRLRAVIFLTVLIFCAAGGSVYAWFTLSGMASTNVTPMGGSISNGDASLLISTSRLGPFDKNCELVLELHKIRTELLFSMKRRIVRWMRMHFTEPFT